jgi:hypothetical protein
MALRIIRNCRNASVVQSTHGYISASIRVAPSPASLSRSAQFSRRPVITTLASSRGTIGSTKQTVGRVAMLVLEQSQGVTYQVHIMPGVLAKPVAIASSQAANNSAPVGAACAVGVQRKPSNSSDQVLCRLRSWHPGSILLLSNFPLGP